MAQGVPLELVEINLVQWILKAFPLVFGKTKSRSSISVSMVRIPNAFLEINHSITEILEILDKLQTTKSPISSTLIPL